MVSAKGASEKFRVFCEMAAYDVILFQIPVRGHSPLPPPRIYVYSIQLLCKSKYELHLFVVISNSNDVYMYDICIHEGCDFSTMYLFDSFNKFFKTSELLQISTWSSPRIQLRTGFVGNCRHHQPCSHVFICIHPHADVNFSACCKVTLQLERIYPNTP